MLAEVISRLSKKKDKNFKNKTNNEFFFSLNAETKYYTHLKPKQIFFKRKFVIN